jgi:hypothetical protein
MRIYKYCIVLIAALVGIGLGVSCGLTVAGAGVETTNSFAITAVYRDGSPAAGITARIRAADYLTSENEGRTVHEDRLTDLQGIVSFDSLQPGAYSLELTDNAGKAVVVRCSLAMDTRHIDLGSDTLDPTGSATGVLSVYGATDHSSLVQVYGLERTARATSDGRFVLDNMPRGIYRLQFVPESVPDPVEIPEIEIKAGDTTFVDTLQIQHGCTDWPCDSLVVRQILDTNRLHAIPVDSVAIVYAGRIRELHLDNLDSLLVPAELGQLTALEKLSFRYTRVAALPEEIGNLLSLYRLDLFNTHLDTLPPSLSRCVSLRQLGLGSCRLETIPLTVYDLTNLTTLTLSVNRIDTLLPELFGLRHLKTLHFFKNGIRTIPSDIGELTALEQLILSQNQLTVIPLEMLSLTRLKSLSVNDNAICSAPDTVRTWLSTFDPHWEESQRCSP